jgi:predicted dehydrogenase
MSALRVGIVGTGFGATVHAPAFVRHPRFELVAIASPNRAEAVAKERRIPHAFRSIEEMLAGVELDVVSVASPPFDHHRSVTAALRAGKHVLCEKPFALSVAEAEEMTAGCERAGVVGALCFEFRYSPEIAALARLLGDGAVGPLREVEVTRFGRDLLERETRRARGWWFEREKGGGIANAVMPHFFDLANVLAGRPPRATHGLVRTANRRRLDAEGPFESTVADGAFAFVDYGDGVVARVSSDATTVLNATTVAIHGEAGSGVASGTWFGDLRVFTVGEDDQDEIDVPSIQHTRAHEIPNVPFFLSLLDAFVARIDAGRDGVPTFADGLIVQRQLAAIGYGT